MTGWRTDIRISPSLDINKQLFPWKHMSTLKNTNVRLNTIVPCTLGTGLKTFTKIDREIRDRAIHTYKTIKKMLCQDFKETKKFPFKDATKTYLNLVYVSNYLFFLH